MMIKTLFIAIFFGSLLMAQPNRTLNILIVTGGKDFDEAEFYKIFDEKEHIVYDTISKPAAFKIFNSQFVEKYSAVLFYDGYRTTAEPEKQAFLNLFNKGMGCLFLHHALISHPDWDEYKNIIGGKYHYDAWEVNGKKYGPSTYKHDQDFTVKILDSDHPILKGISGFSIHDETYINVEIDDDIHPILTTDNCEAMKYIGWTKKYLNSDIVCIQLGHDGEAFRNENFRRLIYNSLSWLSK